MERDYKNLIDGNFNAVSRAGLDETIDYCDDSLRKREAHAQSSQGRRRLAQLADRLYAPLSQSDDYGTPAKREDMFRWLKSWQLTREMSPDEAHAEVLQSVQSRHPDLSRAAARQLAVEEIEEKRQDMCRPLNEGKTAKAAAAALNLASPCVAAWKWAAVAATVPAILTAAKAASALADPHMSSNSSIAIFLGLMTGSGLALASGSVGRKEQTWLLNEAARLAEAKDLLVKTRQRAMQARARLDGAGPK